MYITPVNNVIYFRGKTTDETKDKEKRKVSGSDVAVATGATGATGSAIASKGTFKSFSQANKKINTTAHNVKKGVDLASSTAKEAHSVFGKFVHNCKHFKEGILNFGQNITNSKIIKPIMKSKAGQGFATVAGGATAVLVSISGIGEMFSTFTKKAEQLSEG